MAKQNNIVVIGGTACGPKAAARARRCDPQAKITIVEQGADLSKATCGLPYYVSGGQCPECGGKRNRHILPYRKAN